MTIQDIERRRISRRIRRQSRTGAVITARFISVDPASGLLRLRTIEGAEFRARPISNRVPLPDEPLQVTLGIGGQIPIVDNLPS